MTRALSILLLATCCLIFSQQASAQGVNTNTWVGPVDFPVEGRKIVGVVTTNVDYSTVSWYCISQWAYLYRGDSHLGSGYGSNGCQENYTLVQAEVLVPDDVPDAEYVVDGEVTVEPYYTGSIEGDYYNFQAYLEPPLVFAEYNFAFIGIGPARPDIGAIIIGSLYNIFQQGNPSSIPNRCNDTRDALKREYVTHRISLAPTCADFTQGRESQFYSFNTLNSGTYAWALIRAPLIADAVYVNYGLDQWNLQYPFSYTIPRILNSGYRNPVHNFSPQVGAIARQGRHMYGDAADLRNVTRTQQEYNDAAGAAQMAEANYIEPLSGPCGLGCIHADWRDKPGGYQ